MPSLAAPNQAETQLHSLERAAAGIGLHVNAHKTEYMCFNQAGDIATLEGTSMKLVDKFTSLRSTYLIDIIKHSVVTNKEQLYSLKKLKFHEISSSGKELGKLYIFRSGKHSFI